jgi:GTP cyclohydrolase IA
VKEELNRPAQIAARIRAAGAGFVANDNIAEHLREGDREAIERAVEQAVQQLLEALVIDIERDHNTSGTAKRLAKMFVREVFRGRYEPRPAITDFPNAKKLDELYTVGPIAVRSTCSHHMVPILGQAWIGVVPGARVVGLSKFTRLTEWVLARPQIQEEAAMQVADELEALVFPRALGVVIKAQHMCMTCRGVRDAGTTMTTSVLRGLMFERPELRAEFFSIIRGQGFL